MVLWLRSNVTPVIMPFTSMSWIVPTPIWDKRTWRSSMVSCSSPFTVAAVIVTLHFVEPFVTLTWPRRRCSPLKIWQIPLSKTVTIHFISLLLILKYSFVSWILSLPPFFVCSPNTPPVVFLSFFPFPIHTFWNVLLPSIRLVISSLLFHFYVSFSNLGPCAVVFTI